MDHLLRREWNNPDLLTSNLEDSKTDAATTSIAASVSENSWFSPSPYS